MGRIMVCASIVYTHGYHYESVTGRYKHVVQLREHEAAGRVCWGLGRVMQRFRRGEGVAGRPSRHRRFRIQRAAEKVLVVLCGARRSCFTTVSFVAGSDTTSAV